MKDKKIVALLALVLALAVLAGKIIIDERKSTSKITPSSASQETVIPGLHEEYLALPEINSVVRESVGSIATRYEEGTGVILLGFKECPWCQQIMPLLNEAARAEGATVYYLDIKKERSNNTRSPDYMRIVSKLEPHVSKDENGQPRILVPDVSFVRDGEIIWRHENDQSATEAERKDPELYWTDERKQRAITNFREQMKNITKEATDERL